MNNVFNMARLDFYTLKSQTITYLIIPVIAAFFSLTRSPLSVLGFTAAWLVLLINTNIFAIQEKYGLERLYGSLALNKNSVVLGRYISTTLNYLLAFLVTVTVGAFTAFIQGHSGYLNGLTEAFCLSFFVFTLISAIRLPIYFAAGYTKGRILSMVPFLIIAGLVIIQSLYEKMQRILQSILNNGNIIYAILLLISIIAMPISYYIATLCYKNRQ